MLDEFPYDVFLSHSAKDKAVLRPLAERLQADGMKVWFEEGKIPVASVCDRRTWPVASVDDRRSNHRRSQSAATTAKIEEELERSRVPFRPAVAPKRRQSAFIAGPERRRMLCTSAHASGSDWVQLKSGTSRFRDALNKERRFLPRGLDDGTANWVLKVRLAFLGQARIAREPGRRLSGAEELKSVVSARSTRTPPAYASESCRKQPPENFTPIPHHYRPWKRR
jgi:hypothetical protein